MTCHPAHTSFHFYFRYLHFLHFPLSRGKWSFPFSGQIPPCSFLFHMYIHFTFSLYDTAMYSLFLSWIQEPPVINLAFTPSLYKYYHLLTLYFYFPLFSLRPVSISTPTPLTFYTIFHTWKCEWHSHHCFPNLESVSKSILNQQILALLLSKYPFKALPFLLEHGLAEFKQARSLSVWHISAVADRNIHVGRSVYLQLCTISRWNHHPQSRTFLCPQLLTVNCNTLKFLEPIGYIVSKIIH